MVPSGAPDGGDQQSLGDLVALAAKDISQLVRYEVSLAKSELRVDARRVAVSGSLAAIAAWFGALIMFTLCFAYAYLLNQQGLPGGLAAAFAVVAGTLVVLAALAALIAVVVIKRLTKMQMTRKSVAEDLSMLRRGEAGPDGSGTAITNAERLPAGSGAEIPARPLAGG
jgi:uncharacterized membrane protein YqjE